MPVNFHPKCAAPGCAESFDWLAQGKFFRFPLNHSESPDAFGADHHNLHEVMHFWLCERCSRVYTLQYHRVHGVEVRPLWPELPAAENAKAASAA